MIRHNMPYLVQTAPGVLRETENELTEAKNQRKRELHENNEAVGVVQNSSRKSLLLLYTLSKNYIF